MALRNKLKKLMGIIQEFHGKLKFMEDDSVSEYSLKEVQMLLLKKSV
jgi:hypothetical protein